MGDSCCGAALQEIVLSSPGPTGPGVVLHRCSRCGERQYTCGTQVVDPADAFQSLAGTFQADRARVTRPVPAELERRAVGSGARTARSAQPVSTAAAERAALRAAARDEKERAAAAQAAAQAQGSVVDVTDLADLLSGWTVLGATS